MGLPGKLPGRLPRGLVMVLIGSSKKALGQGRQLAHEKNTYLKKFDFDKIISVFFGKCPLSDNFYT